jgi:hypothetical protein
MFTLFNYLKKFESSISETELPEMQFLDIDLYKNENFNLNSYVSVVMSKLKDSNYLIDQLCKTTENLKNEIVEQINSNFNNYVVLISKLQAIDFLVDNIDKPLKNIKKRLVSEINFVEKYISELNEVVKYLKENQKQSEMIHISLNFYHIYKNAKIHSSLIENHICGPSQISKMISSHPDIYFLNDGNYEQFKLFFFKYQRFLEVSNKLYDIFNNNLKDDFYSGMVAEIKENEIKYMSLVEDCTKILLAEFFSNNENTFQNNKFDLIKNLIYLVSLIYRKSRNSNLFCNKILEECLMNEINCIFDEDNKSVKQKIESFRNLYDSKYSQLFQVLKINKNNNSEFYLKLFILPVVEKLNSDRLIFNCVDPINFKNNFNAINNFLSKNYIGFRSDENSENLSSKDIFKIKTFLHSFSFFTYFQYLQNEISKLFIDYISNSTSTSTSNYSENNSSNENDDLFEKYLNTNLIRNSNLCFNYTKTICDLFREKKILLKLIPNFLNFITQCNKFIILKQNDLFENENSKKLLNLLIRDIDSEMSLNQHNYSNLNSCLLEYFSNLKLFLNFFDLDENINQTQPFYPELISIIEKDVYLLENNENKLKLKEKISTNQNLMKILLDTDLKSKEFYKIINKISI